MNFPSVTPPPPPYLSTAFWRGAYLTVLYLSQRKAPMALSLRSLLF